MAGPRSVPVSNESVGPPSRSAVTLLSLSTASAVRSAPTSLSLPTSAAAPALAAAAAQQLTLSACRVHNSFTGDGSTESSHQTREALSRRRHAGPGAKAGQMLKEEADEGWRALLA